MLSCEDGSAARAMTIHVLKAGSAEQHLTSTGRFKLAMCMLRMLNCYWMKSRTYEKGGRHCEDCEHGDGGPERGGPPRLKKGTTNVVSELCWQGVVSDVRLVRELVGDRLLSAHGLLPHPR